MRSNARRGTKRSRSFQGRRPPSGSGAGPIVIVGAAVVLVIALFYFLSAPSEGDSPENEGNTSKGTRESTQPADTGNRGKEEDPAKEVPSERKTYFTHEEWAEARRIAERATGIANKTKMAYEDGVISQAERKKKNREADELYDKAIAIAAKLLKRVPEEDEKRFYGYGNDMRSWMMKKRRLVK